MIILSAFMVTIFKSLQTSYKHFGLNKVYKPSVFHSRLCMFVFLHFLIQNIKTNILEQAIWIKVVFLFEPFSAWTLLSVLTFGILKQFSRNKIKLYHIYHYIIISSQLFCDDITSQPSCDDILWCYSSFKFFCDVILTFPLWC